DIDSYTTLDARIGWKLSKNTEVSLIGQNLLNSKQHEFTAQEDSTPATYNHRMIYGKVSIKF
ncbi:MAG: TonB-dependent receptor, partial [Gammaproteobacteria bacterium]|nr:TonB-dependent receptor [Gammaproteobacteria bacterium]